MEGVCVGRGTFFFFLHLYTYMYIYKLISLGREILKSEIIICFGCFSMHWADYRFIVVYRI